MLMSCYFYVFYKDQSSPSVTSYVYRYTMHDLVNTLCNAMTVYIVYNNIKHKR